MDRIDLVVVDDVSIVGILLTMFDERTRLSHQVRREIETHFPEQVFKTVVPRNVRLAEIEGIDHPKTVSYIDAIRGNRPIGKSVASGDQSMFTTFGWLAIIAGVAAATISAALAIKWFVSWLGRHGLAIFGWYRLVIAAISVSLYRVARTRE